MLVVICLMLSALLCYYMDCVLSVSYEKEDVMKVWWIRRRSFRFWVGRVRMTETSYQINKMNQTKDFMRMKKRKIKEGCLGMVRVFLGESVFFGGGIWMRWCEVGLRSKEEISIGNCILLQFFFLFSMSGKRGENSRLAFGTNKS